MVSEEIVEYIRQAKKSGHSDEQIVNSLQKMGKSEVDIAVAFSTLNFSSKKKSIWTNNWIIILFLLLFFPLGLFLMWKYAKWNKVLKIIITIFFVLILWFIWTIVRLVVTYTMVYKPRYDKINAVGTPPPSKTPNQKVYYFEYGNKYNKVTSPKYHISFSYPAYITAHPPLFIETQQSGELLKFTDNENKSIELSYWPLLDPTGKSYAGEKKRSNPKIISINGREFVKQSYSSPNTQLADTLFYTWDRGILHQFLLRSQGIKNGTQQIDKDPKRDQDAFDYMINSIKISP